MTAQSRLYHRRWKLNNLLNSHNLRFQPRRFGAIALFVFLLVSLRDPLLHAQTPPEANKIEPTVLSEVRQKRRATFFVVLREQADLSQAAGIRNWKNKGDGVVAALRQHALRTQAPILNLLAKSDVQITSYWIVNTIKVTTRDEQLIHQLANLPEVASITAERVWQIPEPIPTADEPSIQSVEWGVSRIHAPEVWSQFNARGQGIVVASIDTGVQFNHPALVNQYRGNKGDGSFDHNYNWFDPARVCGNPSNAPCDNNGHGTHTMGTMVGNDGGANQIGVAPAAQWITAKGCEGSSCSSSSLLAGGQWILAPTDLNGQNPRPDLRPNIVNNSWGGDSGSDPFFRTTIQAWVAAGIFPAFAIGNTGSGCSSATTPGAFPEAFGVGATDSSDNIAAFSSRGPASSFGITKPNVAAPGVSVRSSVPTNSYASFSGTSMATPHVAGVVALLWSANPALVGNVAGTEDLLQRTADSRPSTQCGSAGPPNNVYGSGIVNALAAIQSSLPTHALAVVSSNPGSGVSIGVSPTDNTGQANGVTPFPRYYNHSTTVTLVATPTAGGNVFAGWTGCDNSLGTTCNVIMNSDRTVTASYTNVVSTAAVTLNYEGQLRDRVGQCEFCRNPDGKGDGVFTVTLTGGSGNRTVTGVRLSNAAGGIWDTVAPDVFWTLGIASGLDTALLNGGSDDVNFGLAAGDTFKIFAADFNNAMFSGGTGFTVAVNFADGSSATAIATIPGASQATISLQFSGLLRDRVGQCELCTAPDGKADGAFVVTLNPGSGSRTVTRLHLTNSPGGIWNTQASDGFWSLGAAGSLDGPLLNTSNDAVAFPVSDGSSFVIFAADSQNVMFLSGTVFTLAITFSDGSTASANTTISSAAAASIALTYNGQLRDRVGGCELCLAPDGKADGTFTVTLNAGSGDRTVTQVRLTNTPGGIWDTVSPNGFWSLGVANSVDGALLNGANDAVSFPWTQGSSFTIFAADSQNAMFATGTVFNLTVIFGDGTSAGATVSIDAGPQGSVSLLYDGQFRDRVGQCELCFAPDGKPDGTFTVTLNAGSGNRTITRLHLTNSPGGLWNTQAGDGFWTLGVAGAVDAALLNGTNDSVNFPITEGAAFKLFASDYNDAMFRSGTGFTLAVTFSDGGSAAATVQIP